MRALARGQFSSSLSAVRRLLSGYRRPRADVTEDLPERAGRDPPNLFGRVQHGERFTSGLDMWAPCRRSSDEAIGLQRASAAFFLNDLS
jgi:hypothetical protein